MLKKFTSALVALILGLTGALVLSQPAQAGTGSDCPNQYICVWWDINYNGPRWQVAWTSLTGSAGAVGNAVSLTWMSEEGSSFYNNSPYAVRFHDHSNCGNLGWSRVVPAFSKLNAAGVPNVNDRFMAVQLDNAYPNYC